MAAQHFEIFALGLSFAQARAQALGQRLDGMAADAVGVRVRPHGRHNLWARHGLAGCAMQQRQQCQLGRRKRWLDPPTVDPGRLN